MISMTPFAILLPLDILLIVSGSNQDTFPIDWFWKSWAVKEEEEEEVNKEKVNKEDKTVVAENTMLRIDQNVTQL